LKLKTSWSRYGSRLSNRSSRQRRRRTRPSPGRWVKPRL
jgi:hypothetical protein